MADNNAGKFTPGATPLGTTYGYKGTLATIISAGYVAQDDDLVIGPYLPPTEEETETGWEVLVKKGPDFTDAIVLITQHNGLEISRVLSGEGAGSITLDRNSQIFDTYATNLIPNPDFESGGINGWAPNSQTPARVGYPPAADPNVVTLDNSTAMRVYIAANGTKVNTPEGLGGIPVTPGVSFELSARGSAGQDYAGKAKFRIYVEFYDRLGNMLIDGHVYGDQVQSIYGKTYLTASGEVPVGGYFASVGVEVMDRWYSGRGNDYYDFDRFNFFVDNPFFEGQDTSDLIDRENLFEVRYRGKLVHEFLGTVRSQDLIAEGAKTVTISGPDPIRLLDRVIVLPDEWQLRDGRPWLVKKLGALRDDFNFGATGSGWAVNPSIWNKKITAHVAIGPSTGVVPNGAAYSSQVVGKKGSHYKTATMKKLVLQNGKAGTTESVSSGPWDFTNTSLTFASDIPTILNGVAGKAGIITTYFQIYINTSEKAQIQVTSTRASDGTTTNIVKYRIYSSAFKRRTDGSPGYIESSGLTYKPAAMRYWRMRSGSDSKGPFVQMGFSATGGSSTGSGWHNWTYYPPRGCPWGRRASGSSLAQDPYGPLSQVQFRFVSTTSGAIYKKLKKSPTLYANGSDLVVKKGSRRVTSATASFGTNNSVGRTLIIGSTDYIIKTRVSATAVDLTKVYAGKTGTAKAWYIKSPAYDIKPISFNRQRSMDSTIYNINKNPATKIVDDRKAAMDQMSLVQDKLLSAQNGRKMLKTADGLYPQINFDATQWNDYYDSIGSRRRGVTQLQFNTKDGSSRNAEQVTAHPYYEGSGKDRKLKRGYFYRFFDDGTTGLNYADTENPANNLKGATGHLDREQVFLTTIKNFDPEVGETLRSYFERSCTFAKCEWSLRPGRKLEIYDTNPLINSTYPDKVFDYWYKQKKVMFEEGWSTTGKGRSATSESISNVIVGKDSRNKYTILQDDASIAQFGKREAYIYIDYQSDDAVSLQKATADALQLSRDEAVTWDINVPIKDASYFIEKNNGDKFIDQKLYYVEERTIDGFVRTENTAYTQTTVQTRIAALKTILANSSKLYRAASEWTRVDPGVTYTSATAASRIATLQAATPSGEFRVNDWQRVRSDSFTRATAGALVSDYQQASPTTLFRITSNEDGIRPFLDYREGDWVGISRHTGNGYDTFRIMAISVSVDSDNVETVQLTLVNVIQARLDQLTKTIEKITPINPQIAGKSGPPQSAALTVQKSTLGQLANVTAAKPVVGSTLVYTSGGQWIDRPPTKRSSVKMNLGDGTTKIFLVTHGLGSLDVLVRIIQTNVTPIKDITASSNLSIFMVGPDQVQIEFLTAPATKSFKVITTIAE